MMGPNKCHCLQLEPIPGNAGFLGGIGGDIPDILPSGDWEPFLPEFEAQNKFGLETMNCVQFSFLNVLETLARFYGKTLNLSDRFMYWASGCTANGNSYSNCLYGFFKYGCCFESLWVWISALTRDQYGMEPPDDVKAEAKKLFDDWNLGTRVWVPLTVAGLQAALKKGPLWFCNSIHSMMMYRVDDRLRVFDTYGVNGKGSFGLDYIDQLEAAYILPFTPKVHPKPMPNVVLAQNCLVSGVFPDHIETALHLDGKLYRGDKVEVMSAWVARNEDPTTHRFEGGPVRTLDQKDWDSFPHVNMKDEPLP